jgi:hypothetical protein
MSHILDYFKVYNSEGTKVRLGVNADGGYVISDIGNVYDCYISAGVSNEESFSRDFINKYNMTRMNSFAFDGTITSYPYNYTKNITFVRKNINAFIDDKNVDLSNLIKYNNNIFLKMDIEGGEYPWLLSLTPDKLDKFAQIVMEFHGINDDTWGTILEDKIKCFEKLSNSHYIVHAHGNNCGGINQTNIPNVIELTYINKRLFHTEPELNNVNLPIKHLDFSNNSSDDLDLNFPPFVNEF